MPSRGRALTVALAEITAAVRQSDTAKLMAAAGKELEQRTARAEGELEALRSSIKEQRALGGEQFLEPLARARAVEMAVHRTVARWLQGVARDEGK
jgi:hypothetical protein